MSCVHEIEALHVRGTVAKLRCSRCEGWAELECQFEGTTPWLAGCAHATLESMQLARDSEPLWVGCVECGATWLTGWWHAGVASDEDADSRG